MGFILWIVFAILIASILVYLASLRTRRLLPAIELPPGEKLPKTPLQRLAVLALAAMSALVALAAAIVTYHGTQVWWENDTVRVTVTIVLLASLGVYLLFTLRVRALEVREDGSFDERDGVIMSRSCAGVGGAMMVVMAAWMIGLTEAHRETHLMPTYFLYLVFWSLVMTNVLASVAGVLLASRRN